MPIIYLKGVPYRNNRLLYGTPENEPYEKSYFLDFYRRHNVNIQEYFRHIPNSLITINVSVQSDYAKLCNFLNKKPVTSSFPWLNKT